MFHHGWYTPLTGFASSARTPPPVLASERLMQSWEATGSFWRPETPDKVFWGTIAFNPGECTKLVLTGDLFGNNSRRLRDEVPVLHGRLFNGAPCSLFSCWCNVEFYVTDRKHFRTQAFSHLSIFGGHWSEVDVCRFDRLQVRFSHLDQWFDNPYDIRYKRDFTRSLLTFKPDKLDADFVFQDVPVHLESGCGRSVPFEATPEGARWSYQYHLILKPESSQPINWLLELTSVLREFFVFLIGSGVYTLDLVGISGSMETKNLRECQVNHPVTVPAVVRTDSRYFSTRHRDYKESLPSIMRTWFERRDELEIAAKAYTELLCTDGMSPEAIFLRTIQTLEHFYGALWPEESRYIERSIFRKFSKWLRNNFLNSQEDFSPKEILILESHKSDLLERIGNINRLSLRDKLQRIFYETPTIFILSEKTFADLN
jgi:hypothetical protein